MNFFINCLKPPGMTSHDVVSFVRRLLKEKKVGHTGTLDPGATGVLPIAVGKATRAIEYLDDDKKYRCEAILGITTTTQDLDGQILTSKGCSNITEEQILEQLQKFIGIIEQKPPMYSAVKVQGKKLYQLARKGETAVIPIRKAVIKDLKVINVRKQGNYFIILFDVLCGKGTYVRTICHDLGERLGCGGTMSFLIRTQSGLFAIEDAFTLEKLSEFSLDTDKYGISISQALTKLNSILLDDYQVNKIINGMAVPVKLGDISYKNLSAVKIFSEQDRLIGIGGYKVDHSGTWLKMKKSFILRS
ncbi:MAG: tRNA pseudouridine(55) synthase TruB [Clostridia bacterium]|jgi:tRNA pseudouridine55 synthase|nr:tRNA pseudouridine(55) synthase TruB [Clostridia bacterium]